MVNSFYIKRHQILKSGQIEIVIKQLSSKMFLAFPDLFFYVPTCLGN